MPALILAGRRGASPKPGYLGRIAASCRTAGSRPTGYGRGRPLRQPAGPRQTSMLRIPGPQGLRQDPGHPPAQEAQAGIGHATLPGPSVAGRRAQVEQQILPDRLHLMHAATVMAQVGDVCHWAPARENGPREQATKNSGPSPQPRRVAAVAARVRSNTPTVRPRRARRQGKPTQSRRRSGPGSRGCSWCRRWTAGAAAASRARRRRHRPHRRAGARRGAARHGGQYPRQAGSPARIRKAMGFAVPANW
jgi:hypothetical protein